MRDELTFRIGAKGNDETMRSRNYIGVVANLVTSDLARDCAHGIIFFGNNHVESNHVRLASHEAKLQPCHCCFGIASPFGRRCSKLEFAVSIRDDGREIRKSVSMLSDLANLDTEQVKENPLVALFISSKGAKSKYPSANMTHDSALVFLQFTVFCLWRRALLTWANCGGSRRLLLN